MLHHLTRDLSVYKERGESKALKKEQFLFINVNCRLCLKPLDQPYWDGSLYSSDLMIEEAHLCPECMQHTIECDDDYCASCLQIVDRENGPWWEFLFFTEPESDYSQRKTFHKSCWEAALSF
jgi:hypothetical protein